MTIHYTWYDSNGNIVTKYEHNGSIETEIAEMKQVLSFIERVVVDITL